MNDIVNISTFYNSIYMNDIPLCFVWDNCYLVFRLCVTITYDKLGWIFFKHYLDRIRITSDKNIKIPSTITPPEFMPLLPENMKSSMTYII